MKSEIINLLSHEIKGLYLEPYFGAIEYTGGLVEETIKSVKIPANYLIILADDLNDRVANIRHISGPRKLPNLKKYGFVGQIRKIIIQNIKNKIVFWDRDVFTGRAFVATYGKYVLPEIMQFKINSININIPMVKIYLYYDINFTDLFGIIKNDTIDIKQIFSMNNDRIIKSLFIESLFNEKKIDK